MGVIAECVFSLGYCRFVISKLEVVGFSSGPLKLLTWGYIMIEFEIRSYALGVFMIDSC